MAKAKLLLAALSKSRLAIAGSAAIGLTSCGYSIQLEAISRLYEREARAAEVAYPDLKLGEISKASDDMLFVPGSITLANQTGHEFTAELEKRLGIRPSFINSQMDLLDYPGQFYSSETAKARNALVIEGVRKFIDDSSESEVTIIAHSAGTKTALSAANLYYKENPSSHKKVNVILLGAGSPEGGLDEALETISKDLRISITELRTHYDLVPLVGGPKSSHLTVRVDSPVTHTVKALTSTLPMEELDFDEPHTERRTATCIGILTKMLEDHDSVNYLDGLTGYLSKKLLKKTAAALVPKGMALATAKGPIAPIPAPSATGKKQELY
jgi:hypothetical protein